MIVVLILGMTYALTSEGLWGAALMFFNVLFAGIIAFNFYEPLAALLAANVERSSSGFADTLCLMVAVHRLARDPPADDRDARPGDGPVPDAGLPHRPVLFGFAGSRDDDGDPAAGVRDRARSTRRSSA